ncbi:MAG: DNA-binding protein [Bacteroidetes bacterium]|nr:DNA-binding protein [Bacteroidota bacterium]
MPKKETIERAKSDKRAGKSPGTQAGEFVREEIENIRAGKHGARSAKQAIAIGLSEARRVGVDLKPPAKGETSEKTRKSAQSAYEKGQRHEPISKAHSRSSEKALEKESQAAASPAALSRQARSAAETRKRTKP